MRLEINWNLILWGKIDLHHRPGGKDSGNCEGNWCIILQSFMVILIFLIPQLLSNDLDLLNLRTFLKLFNDPIILSLVKWIKLQDFWLKVGVISNLRTFRDNIVNILFRSFVFELKSCLRLEDIRFSSNNQSVDIVGCLQLFVDDLVYFFRFFIELI